MKVTVAVKRFNPEKDDTPAFHEYEVDAAPTDRVLDVLMHIQRKIDPSLAFRKSCGHGVCGSDAMVINGRERLACKTLLKELTDKEGTKLIIEPLRTLPVQKDLMVDQTEFFQKYRRIKPFFINNEKAGPKERRQSPEQRKIIDAATSCILCSACYSACPVVQGENPLYLGPAAIVQASRFNNDSRDRGFELRLPELDDPDGIWPCNNYFNCTQVCPRNIKVTKIINLEKNKIKKFHGQGEGHANPE